MTEPQSDPHAAAQQMADLLAGMMESIQPISEACNGYRLQMEREGWSAEQANLVAGEMHLQFIRFLFETMKGALNKPPSLMDLFKKPK